MLDSKLTGRLGRWLRQLALCLTLATASVPLAAMEELTVDGAKEAAQKRAQQELFLSQMEAYSRAVGAEFKSLVKADLERAIRNEPRLAAVGARTRG